MDKRILVFTIAAGLAAQVDAAELRRVENPIQGQYIVVFKDGGEASVNGERRDPRASVADRVADIAGRNGLPVDLVYEHALQGFVTRASEARIRRLLTDDRIAFIEEDGISYPTITQFNATWGLDRVDQRNLPLNGTYVYDSGAATVRAYVIDTGILATHPDLSGRVLTGTTFVSDGNGTSDCDGHGTHVAGTIAGTTWGIAKQARVVPVRVFGCEGTGGAANSTIAAAIDWVRANHVKPAVVNMSLGGSKNSTVDTATNNLINAGVLAVVAAGNSNANACNFSPANVSAALTLGATTSNDARASFSNSGSCLDLFAPGNLITSAWLGGGTLTISGTSMAAPHATGTAALYLEANPTATPSQVANAIITNATTGKVTSPGSGSPNRLLYTRFIGGGGGSAPTITLFVCPDMANSGGGTYVCRVEYSSSTPVTIKWNGFIGEQEFVGNCFSPGSVNVTVEVSNASGSDSRSASFACPSGPIP